MLRIYLEAVIEPHPGNPWLWTVDVFWSPGERYLEVGQIEVNVLIEGYEPTVRLYTSIQSVIRDLVRIYNVFHVENPMNADWYLSQLDRFIPSTYSGFF